MTGKINSKGAPFYGLTIDVYESIVLLDNTVNGGQAQAGALARLLGCKKGLKQIVLNVFSIPQPLSLTASMTYLPGRK